MAHFKSVPFWAKSVPFWGFPEKCAILGFCEKSVPFWAKKSVPFWGVTIALDTTSKKD